MNHFLKDFMFLRDNLKDRYSLVGKSSDITGERVELDLKQDRLFTYGLISDLSFATDLLNSRKLVSKLFFFFSLISVFFFIPPINSSQQFFLLKVFVLKSLLISMILVNIHFFNLSKSSFEKHFCRIVIISFMIFS